MIDAPKSEGKQRKKDTAKTAFEQSCKSFQAQEERRRQAEQIRPEFPAWAPASLPTWRIWVCSNTKGRPLNAPPDAPLACPGPIPAEAEERDQGSPSAQNRPATKLRRGREKRSGDRSGSPGRRQCPTRSPRCRLKLIYLSNIAININDNTFFDCTVFYRDAALLPRGEAARSAAPPDDCPSVAQAGSRGQLGQVVHAVPDVRGRVEADGRHWQGGALERAAGGVEGSAGHGRAAQRE